MVKIFISSPALRQKPTFDKIPNSRNQICSQMYDYKPPLLYIVYVSTNCPIEDSRANFPTQFRESQSVAVDLALTATGYRIAWKKYR